MRRSRTIPVIVFFLVCAAVAATGTGPSPEVDRSEAGGPFAFREIEIRITYIEGFVETKSSRTDWQEATIGDRLPSGAQVRVETDSLCELLIGGRAQVVITDGATVVVDALLADAAAIAIELHDGTVSSRIGKLAGVDRYEIRSPTAVVGVRGTEFAVYATDDSTMIVVREGEVTMVPPEIADALSRFERAGESDDIAEIRAALPSVGAGGQLTFDQSSLLSYAESIAGVASALEDAASAAALGSRDLRRLPALSSALGAFDSAMEKLAPGVASRVVPVDANGEALLERTLDRMDELDRPEIDLDRANWTAVGTPPVGTPPVGTPPVGTPPAREASETGETRPAGEVPEPPYWVTVPRIEIDRSADTPSFALAGKYFVPRGVNYSTSRLVDSGAGEIAAEFAILAEFGYTVVRLYLEAAGPGGLGNPDAPGLDPDVVDAIAEFVHLGANNGLYVIVTSRDLPVDGGYAAAANEEAGVEIGPYRNAYFLTRSGIESAKRYWSDLLDGLIERDAPIQHVLGYNLVHEFWIAVDDPPFTLEEGEIIGPNGSAYAMPDQADALATDGVISYLLEVGEVIRSYDPMALIGVGAFPPYTEKRFAADDFRWATIPGLYESAPVDFFEINVTPLVDISPSIVAEQFGLGEFARTPIVINGLAPPRSVFDTPEAAAGEIRRWIDEFVIVYHTDGWTYEHSVPVGEGTEASEEAAFWGFFDDDAELLRQLAGAE